MVFIMRNLCYFWRSHKSSVLAVRRRVVLFVAECQRRESHALRRSGELCPTLPYLTLESAASHNAASTRQPTEPASLALPMYEVSR